MATPIRLPKTLQVTWIQQTDILVAIGVIATVLMIIIPLPALLLDVLLAISLMLGVIILLTVMYTTKAIEFSVFPSLLLIVTVFRLALNISTTRLILLKGEAFDVRIIRAFGEFVVAGNYIVGFIIFLIIVAVQFIVITKGANRISEVAARFTLDALPGKQMSIDMDLNAGLITEREAIQRRQEIRKETDFYGSMDGAAKFIQGEVKVALVITAINIIGGIITGTVVRGETISAALRTYALLTVGDGLVSQIPALLISTATGIIVTRAISEESLGKDLAVQVSSQHRALWIAAGFIFALALVPGFPKLPLFMLSGLIGFLAYQRTQTFKDLEMKKEKEEKERLMEARRRPEKITEIIKVDPVELEIGYSLIPLVDVEKKGDLLERITMVRRQAALEMGLLVPPIRIRDNIRLEPSAYTILVKGVEVGKGKLRLGKYLAMSATKIEEEIVGEPTLDPVFSQPALWISESERQKAELVGYTVCDLSTIITTHLTEIIKRYAHEILTRDEVNSMLEGLKQAHPTVVDEALKVITVGGILKILQNLLREQISIRDMVTILETITDYSDRIKDIDVLTEYVRVALKRQICSKYQNEKGELEVITIAPDLEDLMVSSVQETDAGKILALEPEILRKIINKTVELVNKHKPDTRPILVLTSQSIRGLFKAITERVLPNLAVISYNELIRTMPVKTIDVLTIDFE